jgi:uncharacterized lipoprotein YmbA
MPTNLKVTSIVLALCVAAIGCSPLAPRPNYTKFFILTPVASTASPVAPATSFTSRHLIIGIGPIDFPDYLKRSQVVTRSAPNRLDLSPVDRWGEPLDKNFQRILSENMAQLLNTSRIEQYPWDRKAHVDYQIEINVENFETSTNGQSQLRARWTIKNSDGKDLYSSETVTGTPVGTGDTGTSAALSNDLSTFSNELASRVSELSQRRYSYSSDNSDPRPSSIAAAQP